MTPHSFRRPNHKLLVFILLLAAAVLALVQFTVPGMQKRRRPATLSGPQAGRAIDELPRRTVAPPAHPGLRVVFFLP